MRYMHAIFGRPSLVFDDSGRERPSTEGGNSLMLGKLVQGYLDNIPVFSKTKDEHLIHVCMVLETLKYYRRYTQASKCQFGRTSTAFLCHAMTRYQSEAWFWTLVR
jgi:hypothetical protein